MAAETGSLGELRNGPDQPLALLETGDEPYVFTKAEMMIGVGVMSLLVAGSGAFIVDQLIANAHSVF